MWLTKAVVLQSLRLNCLCLLGVQALINKVVLFVEGILSTEQQKKIGTSVPHSIMYQNSKDLQITASFEFPGLSEEWLELATRVNKSALIIYRVFICELKSL